MSAKNFVVSVNSASDSINISGIMDGVRRGDKGDCGYDKDSEDGDACVDVV